MGLLNTVVRGSASDPARAWLEQDGVRVDVLWAYGLSAAFSPDLAVVDASGDVILRDGDAVTGACVVESDGIRTFLVTLQ